MKISTINRDALARISASEMSGVSLDAVITALLFEHCCLQAVATLETDPEALDEYQREAYEWAELDTAIVDTDTQRNAA